MINSKLFLLLSSFAILLNLSSCKTQETEDWTAPTSQGPWDGSISMATSEDGVYFEKQKVLFERSGVPNLLKLESGDLILTYQYFSDNSKDMFDVIAYSVSDDNGETWSDTKAIEFEGVPSPAHPGKVPMDPSLVQLEDGRLRIYFTYHAEGNKSAALYSATTDDEQIDSIFTVEETPGLIVSENLLDPAVVFFEGLWHHYSWKDKSELNYHSTSEDGLTFTRQDDIELDMDFLGQVIPFESGLKFFGTGGTAISKDGYAWEMLNEKPIQGADPGVQQLEDGSYIMVYTSMNFNTL